MNRDRMNSVMQDWMDKQKKQEVITGQLVVEDGKVSLQQEDGSLVELSKNARIEVKNGDRFEPAQYSRILEIVDFHGRPVYAELYASVEQPIKKGDIKTALWNEISDTCEEIYEGIIGDVDGAIKIQEAVEGYLKKAAANTTTFNNQDITPACSGSLSLQDHQASQGLLGEQGNLLQSQSGEPCCIERVQIHANLQSALAESQVRVRNLLSPKDSSGCNQ